MCEARRAMCRGDGDPDDCTIPAQLSDGVPDEGTFPRARCARFMADEMCEARRAMCRGDGDPDDCTIPAQLSDGVPDEGTFPRAICAMFMAGEMCEAMMSNFPVETAGLELKLPRSNHIAWHLGEFAILL